MFSDHLIRPERWPVINLFVLAGLLVVLCQLLALGLVVDSQMDKADVRDQRNREHVAAMADCVDRMQQDVRPLRHGCIQQVQAARDAVGYPGDSLQRAAMVSASALDGAELGVESLAAPALMTLTMSLRAP